MAWEAHPSNAMRPEWCSFSTAAIAVLYSSVPPPPHRRQEIRPYQAYPEVKSHGYVWIRWSRGFPPFRKPPYILNQQFLLSSTLKTQCPQGLVYPDMLRGWPSEWTLKKSLHSVVRYNKWSLHAETEQIPIMNNQLKNAPLTQFSHVGVFFKNQYARTSDLRLFLGFHMN